MRMIPVIDPHFPLAQDISIKWRETGKPVKGAQTIDYEGGTVNLYVFEGDKARTPLELETRPLEEFVIDLPKGALEHLLFLTRMNIAGARKAGRIADE